MTDREPTPEDCPPVAAQEITDERVVFRLAKTNPATLDDFRSQRAPLAESGMMPESGFILHDRLADLKGMLDKADLGAGTWSILTEKGPYSGKIKQGGPRLAGLKLGGVYHFSCMEEIENGDATGREQRTLYLLELEPV
ncbi:MAG TPA: hypothetical protein VKX17_10605 [Planctomycetota bacterium]|nr:hypothetical protein [Planctomycetota bacterium]